MALYYLLGTETFQVKVLSPNRYIRKTYLEKDELSYIVISNGGTYTSTHKYMYGTVR